MDETKTKSWPTQYDFLSLKTFIERYVRWPTIEELRAFQSAEFPVVRSRGLTQESVDSEENSD